MRRITIGLSLLTSFALIVGIAHAQTGGGAGGAGAGGGAAAGAAGTGAGAGATGDAATGVGTGPEAGAGVGAGVAGDASAPGAGAGVGAGAASGIGAGARTGTGTGVDTGLDARTGAQTGQPAAGALQQPLPGPQRYDAGAAQPGTLRQQQGVLDRGYNEDRSMLPQDGQGQFDAQGMDGERGELGIWMVSSAGPGVEIQQVTTGSAADEAGLRPGDVLLQVNGRGATSPDEISQLIRQLPAGEQVRLEVWRDGSQQEVVATLRPARAYRTGFRGEGVGTNGDLAERTARLEQQLTMVLRELQQLRQDMAQLRGGPARDAAGFDTGAAPPPADAGFNGFEQAEPPAARDLPAQDTADDDLFGPPPGQQQQTPPPADTTPPADTETDGLFD